MLYASGAATNVMMRLEQVRDCEFEVVFITAHDEYAVQAFKFSAFGYLLKPIKPSELKLLIERLTTYLDEGKHSKSKRLKVLVENYSGEQVRKLVIKNMRGFEVLELRDLVRLESDVNYTNFFMKSGKTYTSSRTLKQYEELLVPHGFCRIHQQHLINLTLVVSYETGEGGTAIMADGSALPVAKKRKSAFVRRFV